MRARLTILIDALHPVSTPAVAAWIAERDAVEMCVTAVSEAELRFGVAILLAGRRRNALEAAMRRWLDLGFAEHAWLLTYRSRGRRSRATG